MVLDEITESEDAVCYVTNVDAEPLEMAIKALEVQIPKKPIDNEECRQFECPTCGRIVVKYYNGTAHHCECGQALDWKGIE